MTPAVVVEHDGVLVVRDDLYPGGTKARFLPALFDHADEVVYASPCEGGAQTALATVAAQLGKRATIFVAKRKEPHARSLMAKRLGAKVLQVPAGYLTVVQARARAYAEARGALLAPFGVDLPEALQVIGDAARGTGLEPDEVWCAAGSGVLMRALASAFPRARLHAVQVGRTLSAEDVAGATIHESGLAFGKPYKGSVPFPCDPHYDAKAWGVCQRLKGKGTVLFWSVTGPAEP